VAARPVTFLMVGPGRWLKNSAGSARAAWLAVTLAEGLRRVGAGSLAGRGAS
jgi:hypothetical protein